MGIDENYNRTVLSFSFHSEVPNFVLFFSPSSDCYCGSKINCKIPGYDKKRSVNLVRDATSCSSKCFALQFKKKSPAWTSYILFIHLVIFHFPSTFTTLTDIPSTNPPPPLIWHLDSSNPRCVVWRNNTRFMPDDKSGIMRNIDVSLSKI